MLAFRRGGSETGRIVGDGRRLDLIQEIIGTGAIDDAGLVLLPRELEAFGRLSESVAAEVARLLDDGSAMVERVERLVCALFEVPDDLTDAVVTHARARAARK